MSENDQHYRSTWYTSGLWPIHNGSTRLDKMDQRHHSSSSHHLVEAMQSTSIDTLSPPLFAGSSLDPSVALPCAADTSRSSAFEQHLLSLVRSIQGEGSLSPTGSQKSISQLTNSSTNGGRTVIPIDSGVADLEVKTNYEMGSSPLPWTRKDSHSGANRTGRRRPPWSIEAKGRRDCSSTTCRRDIPTRQRDRHSITGTGSCQYSWRFS